MRTSTTITWTDVTWNPWLGCKKVSPACKFCYMYRAFDRNGLNPEMVVKNKTQFKKPLYLKKL